jgi:hypothetical protein
VHLDGLQGPRVQPKQLIDHDFLAVSTDPPFFFPEPIDLGDISPDTHFLDDYLGTIDRTRAVRFPASSIVVFDSLCPHQAAPAELAGWRSLAKLAYGVRQYDREGNTINMLFADDYDAHGWQFQPRFLPSGLLRKDGSSVSLTD